MEVELLTNRLSNIMKQIMKNHMEVLVNKEKMQDERFVKKDEPQRTVDGFFAHEVTPVVPEAVHGEKDAELDGKGGGYQELDYSKLVTVTVAAPQEALAKIETLETKVAALESA